MSSYTRGDLKERISAGIKGKGGILLDFDGTVNDVVRSVSMDELDMRSLRRKAELTPGLFDEVYAYPLPVDTKGNRIIGITNQASAQPGYRTQRYSLIPFEDFIERRKVGTMAMDSYDSIRRMLIAGGQNNGTSVRIATLDSLTGDTGVWGTFGTANAISTDNAFFIYGSGSIRYDIGPAIGATAGIENTTLTAFDFSDYLGSTSSVFVYAYLSDKTGVNSFTLRIGQDNTVYYTMTATQTHFGTALANGWNLIRFDFDDATTVGGPVDATDGRYIAVYMNKETTKVTTSGYRFDTILLGNGVPQQVTYYSQFAWLDSITGARTNIAARDGDVLVADEDEYNLYVWKGIEMASIEADEMQSGQYASQMFAKLARQYGMNYPSEAMLVTTDYQAQYYI